MRAAVLHRDNDLRLEDVDEPVVGPGDVLIDIAHNGLCGSDLKLFQTGLRAIDVPHPTTRFAGPQILGHEFSGVVAAVGSAVAASGGPTALHLGERVCVEPLYPCGRCSPCERGLSHLCQILTFHGVISAGGGLSERTVVPAHMVHRLPATVSLEQGALIEPMSVSYHAVERCRIEPGDHAVVVGAGPIGIGVYLALRARGVSDVLMVEPAERRRATVERLGGEAVHPDDLASALTARRRGGADVVFDCAGSGSSFPLSCAAARARGQVVVVAGSAAYPLSTSAYLLQHTEITITGSLAFVRSDLETVIDLMAAGAYPLDGWVEHIDFADVVDAGFRDLIAGRRTKVLVDIN